MHMHMVLLSLLLLAPLLLHITATFITVAIGAVVIIKIAGSFTLYIRRLHSIPSMQTKKTLKVTLWISSSQRGKQQITDISTFWGSPGQTIASSNEATLNFIYCWEYSKLGLHSGFGTFIFCPAYSSVCAGAPMFLNANVHGRDIYRGVLQTHTHRYIYIYIRIYTYIYTHMCVFTQNIFI